jgi:hypothetical protein
LKKFPIVGVGQWSRDAAQCFEDEEHLEKRLGFNLERPGVQELIAGALIIAGCADGTRQPIGPEIIELMPLIHRCNRQRRRLLGLTTEVRGP